jgi:hypothetical protein
VLVSGCFNVPAPPPVVPPFRLQPTGAGFETAPSGRPIRFYEGARNDGWVRVASLSARVFGSDGRRVGRLRPDSDGFAIERRDASVACRATVAATVVDLNCDDAGVWRVEVDAAGAIAMTRPVGGVVSVVGSRDAATAVLESGDRIEVSRTGPDYAISAGPWRRSALDARELTDARSLVLHTAVRSSTAEELVPTELIAASVLWAAETLLRPQPVAAEATEGSAH